MVIPGAISSTITSLLLVKKRLIVSVAANAVSSKSDCYFRVAKMTNRLLEPFLRFIKNRKNTCYFCNKHEELATTTAQSQLLEPQDC